MSDVSDVPEQSYTPDDAASGRLLAALCVSSFLAALNFFALTPFYPEIARDLDSTVPRLGFVATLVILISAVLGLLIGPLSDRYGYRWPLTIGVLAVAMNLGGAGLASSYPALLAVSIFGGIADALVFGLPLAIAGMRFKGEAQRKAIGWTLASLSAAPIFGIPLLTLVGDATSWRAAMVASGLFSACIALFVFVSVPSDKPQRVPFELSHLWAAYMPLLSHNSTLRLYAANALRSVTWIGFLTYLGAFLGDELGLGTRQIGLVFTVGGIGAATGSIFGGRIFADSHRTLAAVSFIISSIVCALTFGIGGIWITVPAALLFSLMAAIGGVAIATLLVNESPAGIGTTMVFNGSLMNFGAAGGAAIGAVLLSFGGYVALGIGLPAFALAAAVLARWPVKR